MYAINRERGRDSRRRIVRYKKISSVIHECSTAIAKTKIQKASIISKTKRGARLSAGERAEGGSLLHLVVSLVDLLRLIEICRPWKTRPKTWILKLARLLPGRQTNANTWWHSRFRTPSTPYCDPIFQFSQNIRFQGEFNAHAGHQPNKHIPRFDVISFR